MSGGWRGRLHSPSFALCPMSAPDHPIAVDVVSVGHTCNTLQEREGQPHETQPFSRNHGQKLEFHLLSAARTVFHIVRVQTNVGLDVLQLQDRAAGDVLKP